MTDDDLQQKVVNKAMNKRTQMMGRHHIAGILIVAIGLVIALGILLVPMNRLAPAKASLSEYSSVNAICELATLKCFYHNVAMFEEKPGGGDKFFNDIVLWPFGGLVNKGYKQFWLEYSGIVEIGIDASQIRFGDPDSKGVVEVYLPNAKVLSVYADENSMSEPIAETGFLTTITGNNQAEAFATAQSAMRQEAENDQSLLRRARDNARLLLEQYIINTGKGMGVDYSVKWINDPL